MSHRNRKNTYRPLAEMNMTPFIDVMMVLLIIFMVTAPLMSVGINVDLPEANAGKVQQNDNKPLTVTIDNDGKIYVDEIEVSAADMIPQIETFLQKNNQTTDNPRILLRGDKAIDYGRIMDVMSLLTEGGYTKVALIANHRDSKR